MSKPDAPAPPDPLKTSAAQTGTNVSTAIANAMLNNVNQTTPYGSKSYDATGSYSWTDPVTEHEYEIPTFTQSVDLNRHGENMQGMNRKVERNLGQMAVDQSRKLGRHLSRPVNARGLPQAGDAGAISSGDEAMARAEAAMMERMNPYLERDREALRTQLSNQGIKLGSEAYDRGMEDFGRQSNDARLGAILSAGQEASRVFDMDLGRFNAANSSRDRALQERFALRNQPINEITALTSGSQVTMPTFGATPVNRMPTTDVAGIYGQNYRQQQQNYRSKLNQRNQMLGGLFGLGAAGIGAI